MLKTGDSAPNLILKNQEGKAYRLNDLRGRKCIVLFFYPKTGIASCAEQIAAFHTYFNEFEEMDTEVVGISQDDQYTQHAFARDHGLHFVLLSDKDGSAARAFGVKKWLGMRRKKVTFVVNLSGTIIEVIDVRNGTTVHVRLALEALVRDRPWLRKAGHGLENWGR
jgi:thioredoxin-dependent peroxiredoxin